jgi:hypothetical protein
LIESADSSFEISPNKKSGAVVDYQVPLAMQSLTSDLSLTSVVDHENRRYFLDRSVNISKTTDAIELPPMRLKNLRVLTPEGWERPGGEEKVYVEQGQGLIRLTVQSKTPIQFVRLRTGFVSNNFENSQLQSRVNLNPNIYPRHSENPSHFETAYSEVQLSANQFRQRRRGNVLLLEIPVQHFLTPPKIEEGGEVRHRISRFFTQTFREKKVKGWDTGVREISQLEVVNESFQKAQIHGPTSYRIETTPLEQRAVSPKSTGAFRCNKIHQPQYLPKGEFHRGEKYKMDQIQKRVKALFDSYI